MARLGSRCVATAPCLETTAARQDAIGTVVLEAISRESGTDVLELPSLQGVVDTRALEEMFTSYQTDWCLAFQYYGYDVVVEADRSVALYEAE